ncbi:hypothetical protein [Methanosarcina mazei]|nr:hypothetical protein [Methanosarcina mazei]
MKTNNKGTGFLGPAWQMYELFHYELGGMTPLYLDEYKETFKN